MADTVVLERGTKLTAFINQVLPDYRKRTVYIVRSCPKGQERTPPIGGWTGGSITYALRVVVAQGAIAVTPMKQRSSFMFSETEEQETIAITDNQAMVTHGTVNSKPATAFIYCTETFCAQYLSPFPNLP